MDRCFGVRNETRDRARRLFYGGQVLFSTIKCATKVLCRDGKFRNIIKREVYSSLKTEKYEVYLFFDSETGKYVDHPFSKCTCRAGNYFCGNMLALFLILRLVQLRHDIPFSTIQSVLPAEIMLLIMYSLALSCASFGRAVWVCGVVLQWAAPVQTQQPRSPIVMWTRLAIVGNLYTPKKPTIYDDLLYRRIHFQFWFP